MAEVDSSLIKKGFWINHSQGNVLGATITTDQQLSNLIIALLAILVALAAGSAWSLLLFVLHQLRATSKPVDGLFLQQQALYRSLAPPGSIIADSLKMLKIWKGKAPHAILRCLFPAGMGLIFGSGGLAAGILSSYIVSTSNVEVLVDGSRCRQFSAATYYSPDISTEVLTAFNDGILIPPGQHAEQCYGSGPVPSRCDTLVEPRINVTLGHDECPFGQEVCLLNGTRASVVLDTGYMDSAAVFGINAVPRDRVQLRRQTTCAPLQVLPFTELIDPLDRLDEFVDTYERQPLRDETIRTYKYGAFPTRWSAESNETFWQSSIGVETLKSYTVQYGVAYASPDLSVASGWLPIRELKREDADMTIILVETNLVKSSETIDGPIYSAHRVYNNYEYVEANRFDLFMPDFPAGALACAEQYQYCASDQQGRRQCTPLSGAMYQGFEDLLPFINDKQLATLQLLASATTIMGIVVPSGLQRPYLDSIAKSFGPYIAGFPEVQWERDVMKLESWVLAGLQTLTLQHVTGYPDGNDLLLQAPFTPGEKALCTSHKVVKSGGVANISVFGLAFIVGLAVLLVLLDFGVLRILVYSDICKKRLFPGIGFWIQDGLFQVQRCAYELYGAGTWTRAEKEIPVASTTDRFRSLDHYKSESTASLSQPQKEPLVSVSSQRSSRSLLQVVCHSPTLSTTSEPLPSSV